MHKVCLLNCNSPRLSKYCECPSCKTWQHVYSIATFQNWHCELYASMQILLIWRFPNMVTCLLNQLDWTQRFKFLYWPFNDQQGEKWFIQYRLRPFYNQRSCQCFCYQKCWVWGGRPCAWHPSTSPYPSIFVSKNIAIHYINGRILGMQMVDRSMMVDRFICRLVGKIGMHFLKILTWPKSRNTNMCHRWLKS